MYRALERDKIASVLLAYERGNYESGHVALGIVSCNRMRYVWTAEAKKMPRVSTNLALSKLRKNVYTVRDPPSLVYQ